MGDRDGIDPRKPWGLYVQRRRQYIQTASYDNATDVIAALTTVADPSRIIVRHHPTDRDGNGADFLTAVNRHMSEDRL